MPGRALRGDDPDSKEPMDKVEEAFENAADPKPRAKGFAVERVKRATLPLRPERDVPRLERSRALALREAKEVTRLVREGALEAAHERFDQIHRLAAGLHHPVGRGMIGEAREAEKSRALCPEGQDSLDAGAIVRLADGTARRGGAAAKIQVASQVAILGERQHGHVYGGLQREPVAREAPRPRICRQKLPVVMRAGEIASVALAPNASVSSARAASISARRALSRGASPAPSRWSSARVRSRKRARTGSSPRASFERANLWMEAEKSSDRAIAP